MKLSKPSRYLLIWLSNQPTRGCATTTPIDGAGPGEQPEMIHIRGLVRRGWARESDRSSGIFFLTPKGLEMAAQLKEPKRFKGGTRHWGGPIARPE